MSVDFESVKDKAVVLAQSGMTKARELADAGAARARELSEIGKLKMQNSTEKEAIRKAYSDLGRLYYAERGSAPEAAYAELCQRVTDALSRISYNNERIADIKAAGRSSGVEENVDAGIEEAEEIEAEESCCCAGEPVAEEPCCGTGEAGAPAGESCCCGDPVSEDGGKTGE